MMSDHRFIYPLGRAYYYYDSFIPPQALASDHVLYAIDIDEQKIRPIFTTTNTDPILAVSDTKQESVLMVTRGFIQLVDTNGGLIWRMPFEPALPDYAEVSSYSLSGPPGQYAVLIRSSHWVGDKKLPTFVTWITNGEGVSIPLQGKQMTLPALEQPKVLPRLEERLLTCLAPPWDLLNPHRHFQPSKDLVRMIPECLCAAIGLWLAWRNNFSRGARWGWGAFLLATGIPGLLTLLCVQEWPAREVCVKCHRRRTVDHESCEHCAAGFPPPEKNGTEIFEPLEV